MQNNTSTNPKIVSLNEAARILGIHPETLRRWDKSGKLKALRVGSRQDRKYKLSEIIKMLESQ